VGARVEDVVPGAHRAQTVARVEPGANEERGAQVQQEEEERQAGAERGDDQDRADEDEPQLTRQSQHRFPKRG
jgi:hypothetical protein